MSLTVRIGVSPSRWCLLVVGCLLLALIRVTPAAAAEPDPSAPTDYLCTGRMQSRHGALCPDLGPSALLTGEELDDAENPLPLPTESIDPELSFLPFNYRRLDAKEPTWMYTSVEDARESKHEHRAIDPGFNYASWLECQVVDGKAIYMIEPGIYIRGGSDCSRIATPDFQGLQFYRTPSRPFGWVLTPGYTLREPASGESTNSWLRRYQIVQVYEERQVRNQTWYRIGPSDWVGQRQLSVVRPERARPEGVAENRWISINLDEQTISVYEEGKLVFATVASSGLRGWWTQPGVFQVYLKLEKDRMTGSFEADRSDYYYLQDVPWVLYYDKARAIHGAYWHNGFGYPRSHGCVNLSPADAHWIYQWAEEGTWVHVYDPTGETPTDPEVYGEGGA